MTSTDTHSVRPGRRWAGRSRAPYTRPLPSPSRIGRVSLPRRARFSARRSARRPLAASRAGSTVRELTMATATTRIVPVASEEKMTSVAR